VYVDARGIKYEVAADPSGTGYAGYDESMREMATMFEHQGKMTVRLEDTEVLYCGWYSINNFIPCCKFNRGAVAWHLASAEAISLRHPKTQWCGNILSSGACATLGPVAEPYTIGFPKPAEFFGFLGTGEFTLVESYAHSQMFSSWMITLIGDPLYNPFKKSPKLKLSDVQPSPKGAKVNVGR
jgi:uncharacterized protein (TIGR03790 family)